MVMPSSDYFEGSCGSADTLTSPAPSSATTENTTFFSDEELAQIEDLDLASMMTPIIKAELKSSIFKRLEESGKDVPHVDMDTPTTEELTTEDEERRQVRRVRNKEAAQKCRGKKREKTDQLQKDVEKLEDRQDDLKEEIEKLRREHEALQDMLDAHAPFCKRSRCEVSDIQMNEVLMDEVQMNDVQFYQNNDHTYQNNDHTYTLLEVQNNDSDLVPSLSDFELE